MLVDIEKLQRDLLDKLYYNNLIESISNFFFSLYLVLLKADK